ncbi:hypothetical protein RhiirA1_535611 [Rhizophagus irregularis]|uniref:Protein kinase domain-containing protein n=1 Tax=Rhizophagus irregularis TaxID=588596 RepID=A0A2N0RT08_9GLOM|nr:hypothetical protein RhiirA1_535611 [Rhizophagus irregularis]
MDSFGLIKPSDASEICKKCNCICYAIRFQQNFKNWTSDNDDIDKFIQNTQLSAHKNAMEAIEWIPYDRLYNIKYIAKDKFGKVYRANWIDGYISFYNSDEESWDNENQNWIRNECNKFVNLKRLSTPNILTLKFVNKIKIVHIFYGMTQDPETKNYMMVLDNKCKKCNKICNSICFQQKFIDWTSGNDNINKFIQDTQLSAHSNVREALEWIPYDRLYNIKYITKDAFGKVYRANWIDGYISYYDSDECWDNKNQNWIREECNMFVNLKSLNTPNILTLKFLNKIKIEHIFYGITQNPETKNYSMVLNNKCKKCNYICNSIYFQQEFIDWTSGNDDIDKFVQNTQLSAHNDVREALEWIPYDKLYDIKYIAKDEFGKVYRANWIDGYISYYESDESWDNKNQNWIRKDKNIYVILKNLDYSKNITSKFMKEINKACGITQDLETKSYMMVFHRNKCKMCNKICNAIHFQQKFIDWTSGNDDIDRFIQDTQLSAHGNIEKALEWVSYDKFYNIKYIAKDKFSEVYVANWIDGYIHGWDTYTQDWERKNQNMIVILKSLNNSTLEFIDEIILYHKNHKFYGVTQDPETKSYMVALTCEKCEHLCNSVHFLENFKNWTSGNSDIDKFIQNTQLSAHNNAEEALEWISYDKFYNIKYIAEGKFGEMYRANWIDGCIYGWDIYTQSWKRKDQNMIVILENLNNSTLECINENTVFHKYHKFCGITQDPQTKSYIMILTCKKCNHVCNSIHFIYVWQNFSNWTQFIQNSQLSAHDDAEKALEWISYDRFGNIRYIAKDEFSEVYVANWIDGNLYDHDQNWKKYDVVLKDLNNSKNVSFDKIIVYHKFYGITQDPKTKNYMVVLACEECNYVCNTLHFQWNFINWTSGNDDIDEFIRDTQLLAHSSPKVFEKALEWIPYHSFYDVKLIDEEMYKANWIDGYTAKLNYEFYGITQNPETKEFMMVLNNICEKCKITCNMIRFQQNFKNWASSNNGIDKFIQDAQLSAHSIYEIKNVLEWIPYDKFYNIVYIAKGGFGKVYKANWIDGYISDWNDNNQNWNRYNKSMLVALKSLNNSENVTYKFMNEITLHYKVNLNGYVIKLYGITQEPVTNNYMMVLDYAKDGNLRNYLNTSYNKLSWNDKLNYLHSIAHGLKDIHEKELIHQDLHIGNILKIKHNTAITDMGLCKPADYNTSTKSTYGVLPYIAPECLRGQNYTKAADIYSFGIIMYEVISGLPPYHDVSHDNRLAIKICKGLRPRFNINIPQLIVHLIKRCLDANQLNRPTTEEIEESLKQWFMESCVKFGNSTEIQKQIEVAEVTNNNSMISSAFSTKLGTLYETHSEAIYTSRLLSFNNLPFPKNSDDYYEQQDNIISIESSVSLSLQIDISQFNINEDGKFLLLL